MSDGHSGEFGAVVPEFLTQMPERSLVALAPRVVPAVKRRESAVTHLPGEYSPNFVEVIRTNGSVERDAVVTALEVNEGDVIRVHTATAAATGTPASGGASW